MTDVSRLESLAQQLAARVREDDAESNLRWLRAELGTDPNAPISDVERLLFVAATAIPVNQRWSELTAWCRPTPVDSPVDNVKRRQMRRVA